jgi:hypothetical protein
LLEGFSDEVHRVAMDLGASQLHAVDGVPKLVAAAEQSIHANSEDEAGQLFRVGSPTRGPLSRRPGEPMSGYVSRRARW